LEEEKMSQKILVAYASRAGSTAGIAEAIGKVLREGGMQVDVCPMKEVKTLTEYRGVVAGSAIHGSKWLPDGFSFLKKYRTELSEKRLALFAVCMAMGMDEKYHEGTKEFLASVRGLGNPMSEKVVAGAVDIQKLPSFSERLIVRMIVGSGMWKVGDYRDWQAVKAWAESLKPILLS
jgi:menaquinone-dependent protoporphyrinogen oxidase